jgi:hypothetical protein
MVVSSDCKAAVLDKFSASVQVLDSNDTIATSVGKIVFVIRDRQRTHISRLASVIDGPLQSLQI